MATKYITIGTKDVFKLADALKDMHRSALPNVVRFTLNDLAFNVKKNTLQQSSQKFFINRTKTFFKANSGVQKAKGYDINTMVAEVGMTKKTKASKNLKFQEKGGTIPDRAFIPMVTSRTGKNIKKRIPKRNQLSNIDLIRANKTRGNRKQRLIRSAFKGKQLKKDVLFEGVVYNVKTAIKLKRSIRIKLLPLYSYKRGRSAKVKKSPFMSTAGMKSAQRTDEFFKKNYDRQIDKLKSKHKL